MTDKKIEIHDIVQITDEEHHWFPALVVVSELIALGILGFVLMPGNTGVPATQAYIRLKKERYEKVGRAVIVPSE